MRPLIKPALSWVQRDAETIQIGLDPDHAVVLTGVDSRLMTVLRSLNGRLSQDAVLAKAKSLGVDGRSAASVLSTLAQAGVLEDTTGRRSGVRGLPATERERLDPDVLAYDLEPQPAQGFAGQGFAGQGFAGRRAARVSVHGAGRVGSNVAALLAAAGVGTVAVLDATLARPGDLTPGGLRSRDVGGSRAAGVRRLIEEVAPSTTAELPAESRADAAPPGEPGPPESRRWTGVKPQLAILAPDHEPDRKVADQLLRAGIPHLVVRIRESKAIIGPFVLPGTSSCLRCHDMHRTARDPAWPMILAQLETRPPRHFACDLVLACAAACHAAAHVLAYLRGDEPPSVDRTLELRLPLTEVLRRPWTPHPACPCQFDPGRELPETG